MILIVAFVLGKQFDGFINVRQRMTADAENQIKSVEVKLDLEGRDLRLSSFEIDGSVVTMLIDYTPIPHTPKETDVLKITSIPQKNVIKSWIHTIRINPKVFLSSDYQFLVFEFGEISVYDFEEKELINSLASKIPQIESTSVVRLENNSIILGLFEGREGICDENAFSVDLDSFAVKQLQPKSTMKQCS